MVRSAFKQGTKVIVLPVMVRPEDKNKPRQKRMFFLNEVKEHIAERNKVVYLDTESSFHQHSNEINWFDTFHYDGFGHQLVANELFEFIKSDIIPSGSKKH